MAISIDVEYIGALKTRATHGPSGTPLATAAPVDNQGDGSSYSPTDLCATSLATCMVTVMAITARKHGVELDGARARVEKHMTSEAPRRIARLVVTLELPAGVPSDLRDRLEAAGRGCPVARSLHPDVVQDVTFRWA
jgi:putative redox protein